MQTPLLTITSALSRAIRDQSISADDLQRINQFGALVWIAPAPEGFRLPRTDVETLRPNVMRDRAHLERMLALLDAGAVRPPKIVRYNLADASEAHGVSESRHLQGKLVFEVR